MVSKMTPEKLETFINDHLKEDLKLYEEQLNIINEEKREYIDLQNTVTKIKEEMSDGFKTQVNVSANVFMQAKVEKTDRILVDVGLHHYVEFTLDEALKFIDLKLRILTKHADVIRDESIKTRAQIKLALLAMGGQYNLTNN